VKDYIVGLPAEVFFNFDDLRVSEWGDRKPKSVVMTLKNFGK
jgi:hypothetical protein